MFKKLVLIFMAGLLAFSVAACSKAEASEPWTGDWTADGFSASIEDDTIKVYFESDGTKALYWQGTFEPSSSVVKDEEVLSVKDAEATDASLLGSQSADKVFTAKGGKIMFPFAMVGIEQTIELTK